MITGFLDNAILHVRLIGVDIRDAIFTYQHHRENTPEFAKSVRHQIPLVQVLPDHADPTLVRLVSVDLPDIICLREDLGQHLHGLRLDQLPDPTDCLQRTEWLQAHSILLEWQGTQLFQLPLTWKRLLEVLGTRQVQLVCPDQGCTFDTAMAATDFFDHYINRSASPVHPLASPTPSFLSQQAA